MNRGLLFTTEFLAEGIVDTDHWKNVSDEEMSAFRQTLLDIYKSFPIQGAPNESTTERDLIDPVIEALGWADYLPQQTANQTGRSDVPDYLLFEDAERKEKANKKEDRSADRYKHGRAILEAKAWQIPLDRKIKDGLGYGVPSNQILRYLAAVDVQSNGKIKWGILTNGREWRLYYQGAKSRSEEFLGLDLAQILELPGVERDLFDTHGLSPHHWLKVFYLFFRKQAFIPEGREGETFHTLAIKQGELWESKVAEDLSDMVFNTVLPGMAKALADGDPQRPEVLDAPYLETVREATLILLYRLLFLLYAEDRNLLPANDTKYDDYGLQKRVREDIKKRIDESDQFSEIRDDYFQLVLALCRSVDMGDSSIGLPPYNGGLFDSGRSPLLNRTHIPDSQFAPLFDRLSRHYEEDKKKWINYRDLTVQQLGSIYERFLEYELVAAADGALLTQPNKFARKTTGSYYTPDSLVNLIIHNSVGPLIDEKEQAFKELAEKLKSKKGPKTERIKELARLDPAQSLLTLRICDPAMGSGHFLVSLVDYLADRLLILIEETENHVTWADAKTPYASPVTENIATIRAHIMDEAKKHKWIVAESQLDDRHIVRRMILKRCVYGVDKNPMAVELAKVSLWLHTFTVGAPLSFLDHHLRCGDSLFGEFTYDVEEELRPRGSMFISNDVAKARATAKGMAVVESLTDADIAEVKESASVFSGVAQDARPLTRFFDLVHALRWIEMNKDKEKQAAVNGYFDQYYGDPVKIATNGQLPPSATEKTEQKSLLGGEHEQSALPGQGGKGNKARKDFEAILDEALTIAKEENFLHWEVAFPMVWDNWENQEPDGGFDAVIGNPPWDRMKLQEVEWFAARSPDIAYSKRAADRKKLIKKLKDKEDPLAQLYDRSAERAKGAARVAREIGHYPLLSGGDINLYSLFVERAHRLVGKRGMVGLVVPSGIASDKGASAFFKTISTQGRLAHLYDFENKKVFFPDVHASFKFCTYIAGGEERKFGGAKMAFFLHATDELAEEEKVFTLGPADFERVNPNTGTAPIFRTRRDAQITRHIYERFPVLRKEGEEPVWPVKYFTMFHMTNDSHLFKTKEELVEEGYYPVEGNRMKRGEEEFLPLYVGKMIHHFDHRAASVKVSDTSLHVAASSLDTTEEQYADPNFGIEPQYWVSKDESRYPYGLQWALSFRDIARSTDERTFICTIIPSYPAGNTMPLILPASEKDLENYSKLSPIISAYYSSIALDFIARQKVQSTHVNWYIVEQLPVIPPAEFDKPLGGGTVGDLVRDHVLRLTYTAHDMAPFARDMGYKGKPFVWDEEERRHLRARLDALFFILYGLSRDDASYILETFPIVKKNDEQEHGRYLTRDLILAYMNALTAGDTKTKVKV